MFGASDSSAASLQTTPTRVLAVRPLHRRPLGAFAACPATTTHFISNTSLPARNHKAAIYTLTNAGTSHREVFLASTDNEPLPIPSPAENAVDMRVLLDTLHLYPCLGLDVVTVGVDNSNHGDKDDWEED